MSAANLKIVETDFDPDDLVPLNVGAGKLGLDPSTIRKRKAGTEGLTLIRQGRNLYMVLGEVIAHRQKKIDDARRKNSPIRLVTE
jgi:hypothetical protein